MTASGVLVNPNDEDPKDDFVMEEVYDESERVGDDEDLDDLITSLKNQNETLAKDDDSKETNHNNIAFNGDGESTIEARRQKRMQNRRQLNEPIIMADNSLESSKEKSHVANFEDVSENSIVNDSTIPTTHSQTDITDVDSNDNNIRIAGMKASIDQLASQLNQNQQQTTQAVHELSQTLTNLMMAQMRREKDVEDTTEHQLNVDRATVRLDGLEVYAVVSALTVATSIACFDVYGTDYSSTLLNSSDAATSTTMASWTTDQYYEYIWHYVCLIVNTAFLGISGVGLIAGLHATLVFSLMTMYGRTAVGVSNDEAFVEFFVQTGRVRYRGFQTFRVSLYCFLVQVLFTVTSKSTMLVRPIMIVINLASMYWVYKDTQSVIDKASDILFGNLDSRRISANLSEKVNTNRFNLRRTLSNSSDKDDGPRRSNSLSKPLLVQTTSGGETCDSTRSPASSAGGGATGLAGMRQRARQSQLQQTTTGGKQTLSPARNRAGGRKNPARSKSGVVIYDVAPGEAKPVRRGGRRPSGNR